MYPQFNTKWTGNLRKKKICKEESEVSYLDLKLRSHWYEDVIFNFYVSYLVSLSEVSFINFTSQNFSLRILLILSSCLRLDRPVVLFCLGLFIEMLMDIWSHQRVLRFSKPSAIWFKINSDFIM